MTFQLVRGTGQRPDALSAGVPELQVARQLDPSTAVSSGQRPCMKIRSGPAAGEPIYRHLCPPYSSNAPRSGGGDTDCGGTDRQHGGRRLCRLEASP